MEKRIIKNLSLDYKSTVYQAIKKLNINSLAFLALKKKQQALRNINGCGPKKKDSLWSKEKYLCF